MNEKTFANLVNLRFEICKAVLHEKGVEYSREDDKLYNFKRAADIRELEHPEDALVGMWVKHIVSIFDMVDDLPNLPNLFVMREKIVDSINYLVLLEALFMERIDPDEDP